MDRSKLLQGLSLSKKAEAYSNSHPELYKGLMLELQKQTLPYLFSLMQNPRRYSSTEENNDEFYAFLGELVPALIKGINGWYDEKLGEEFNSYLNNAKPIFIRPRIKVCRNCGADLTEDFAMALTTDALLSGDKVLVNCPRCNVGNYFKPNF